VVDAHFAKYEGRQPGEKKKIVFESVPIGRGAVAADLTGMAIFLATPEADYIVAQTFGVDGGNWLA
ncbi:MAG: L-iditol 2-dehydrogenase, partial [Rhodobacteraceae bacterium]|nr:L-iditol 2-dehydrogenase [Paracoccaceae bacterium]